MGARTRGPCFAIGLFGALTLASPRAGAETRCPKPTGAEPALAATDGRARLEWIDQHLSHEARRMSYWNWGWALGIGASGVGSLIPVPFVAPENRVDYYTGAALAGARRPALRPGAARRDPRRPRAARARSPSRRSTPTPRSASCSSTPSDAW